jgi:tetratricopeptide (TPR) repeat protein
MTTSLHHSRAGRIGAAALAILLGVATAANAQTNGSNGNTTNIPRAEALEAQAVALYPGLNHARVAKLYEQAARLRPDDDPRRVYDLRFAGHMYQRVHKLSASRRNLTLAAETALQYGDLVTAAHAFVDAAWVALEQQDIQAAIRLVQKAECLSHSPLISLVDARALRARLGKGEGPVWVKQ